MANQMIKPYSLLLYLLVLIFSFFVGMSIAGIVDAGKGQGLAGGAIVLSYGLIGAAIGLAVALFLAARMERKTLLKLNIILTIAILAFYGYFHFNYLERQQQKEQEKQRIEQPRKPTAPAEAIN